MKVSFASNTFRISDNSARVTFHKLYTNRLSRMKSAWENKHADPERKLPFEISVRLSGSIVEWGENDIVVSLDGPADVILERKYPTRSLNMNDTYYGILYFMFWAQNGRRPIRDETEPYNEALMQLYGVLEEDENPFTKAKMERRKSQHEMTTVEFANLIDGSLAWLLSMDIPNEVSDAAGVSMEELWRAWYQHKWKNNDIRNSLEPDSMNYEQYKELHPNCELTGSPGSEVDPVERMHLIPGLQKTPFYEQPWAYIRALHSLHMKAHSEANGFSKVFKQYPHAKAKLKAAQERIIRERIE